MIMDKRELIIDAAKSTFMEKGYERTRISDISKRADVGKGTIYEYFGSKDEVLMACCESIFQNNLQGLEDGIEALKQNSPGNPRELLHFSIVTMVEKICYDTGNLRLFMELWKKIQNDSTVFEDFKNRLMAPYQIFESFLLDLISAGMDSGHFFSSLTPRQVTYLISSSIDGLVWQYSFRSDLGELSDSKALADTVLSMLTNTGGNK